MMSESAEKTIQAVGNMRFVVVSQFRESGHTIGDRLKRLLEREAQEKTQNRTLEKARRPE